MTAPSGTRKATAFDWDALKVRTRADATSALTEGELCAVFAERAEALARVARDDDSALGAALLTLLHGDMTFALDLESVLRVLSPRQLTRIPNAPRYLDSVLYEGGRVVSVLDPTALFGETMGGSGPESIVLLEVGDARLGVRATRVIGHRRFDLERLGSPSAALERRVSTCVKGIAEDLTIVFDGTSLVEAFRQH